MKQSTINKYIKFLETVKESGQSLYQYCKTHKDEYNYNTVIKNISNLKKQNENETEDVKSLISLYNTLLSKDIKEQLDSDDASDTAYIRDDSGKIQYYEYKIYRKNKNPLTGKLTREEMNAIHRLYSFYGDSLPQRIVSRYFIDLSLVDFKRILRAFNITKASAPFAPHMIEECSEEELQSILLREKENSFLRKIEANRIKDNEELLKKYAQENIQLKKQLETISSFSITVPSDTKFILPEYERVGQSINLYLADMHIGASILSGSSYKENINYGEEEVRRRLQECLNKLSSFGSFDIINLILMGDNVDCCGLNGYTARHDHILPENMDAMQQCDIFLKVTMEFINALVDPKNEFCSHLNVYSTPGGNHGGYFEYACNKALMSAIQASYNNIQTELWQEYYGTFKLGKHTYICMHGKDPLFMKKPMPLNLDDKTKVMLYEWLEENDIHGDNIHFIKGDLHSDTLSSCKKLDYRNVLSLFGASDYSNFNYSRNSYGLSYDLLIGDNLVRGSFENL